MMKKEIKCSIVQDLLPNYIEKLTSEDTNQVIEEHLNECADCKKTYNQMITEIREIDKAPKAELKFLKKVQKTKLLAAAISIILTLILSYSLYAMEFKYSTGKADLSNAITEYLAPFDKKIDAYALEIKEVDGVLIVSFKNQNHESVNGIAMFVKGFNNKYRIVKTMTESSKYSSVVQPYVINIKGERLIAVSGYNLSNEIKYYGLDYTAYTEPGTLSDLRVERTINFNTPNLQFLEFYNADELDAQLLESEGRALYNYHITDVSFYNKEGNNITDNFKIPENEVQNENSTTAVMELGMVYFFIIIVIGFGIIMVRYFLTD